MFEIYLYKPQQGPGMLRSIAQLNLCALAYSWAQGSIWKYYCPSYCLKRVDNFALLVYYEAECQNLCIHAPKFFV